VPSAGPLPAALTCGCTRLSFFSLLSLVLLLKPSSSRRAPSSRRRSHAATAAALLATPPRFLSCPLFSPPLPFVSLAAPFIPHASSCFPCPPPVARPPRPSPAATPACSPPLAPAHAAPPCRRIATRRARPCHAAFRSYPALPPRAPPHNASSSHASTAAAAGSKQGGGRSNPRSPRLQMMLELSFTWRFDPLFGCSIRPLACFASPPSFCRCMNSHISAKNNPGGGRAPGTSALGWPSAAGHSSPDSVHSSFTPACVPWRPRARWGMQQGCMRNCDNRMPNLHRKFWRNRECTLQCCRM
jgi:hypothetical protein